MKPITVEESETMERVVSEIISSRTYLRPVACHTLAKVIVTALQNSKSANTSQEKEGNVPQAKEPEKMMKVMVEYHISTNKFPDCPKEIPMRLLSEEWAKNNHGQTLDRLNQRGGMGVMEVLDNLKRQKLTLGFKEVTQEYVDELKRLIQDSAPTFQKEREEETDAVEFAEWLKRETYIKTDGCAPTYTIPLDGTIYTTQELYTKFKSLKKDALRESVGKRNENSEPTNY